MNGMTADESLAKLVKGNERFRIGMSRKTAWDRETLAELAKGQSPFATILACSDSRVPPEAVFDAGLGELFVIRVAGNVVSPEVSGSMQYAGAHLKTPLFVVLGHEGCGAVKAAMAAKFEGAQHLSRIQILLDGIMPALPVPEPSESTDQQLNRAVECNVRWTIRQIVSTAEGQRRLAEGVMKIVGAVYEMETGYVRFLGS